MLKLSCLESGCLAADAVFSSEKFKYSSSLGHLAQGLEGTFQPVVDVACISASSFCTQSKPG